MCGPPIFNMNITDMCGTVGRGGGLKCPDMRNAGACGRLPRFR